MPETKAGLSTNTNKTNPSQIRGQDQTYYLSYVYITHTTVLYIFVACIYFNAVMDLVL